MWCYKIEDQKRQFMTVSVLQVPFFLAMRAVKGTTKIFCKILLTKKRTCLKENLITQSWRGRRHLDTLENIQAKA